MIGPVTVNIRVAAEPMMAAADELKALIAQSPPWLQWLAVEAFQNFEHSVDLVCLDDKAVSTPGTKDLWIGAQPGHKLVLLLAALRAGNGQAGLGVDVEFDSHGGARVG